MKKISSLILALFAVITLSAQVTVTNVSPGVVKITYGPSYDLTFYNPGFQNPKFYVHMWTIGADNSTGNSYDDSWSNSNVEMNLVGDHYEGTINFATKVFTNGNKILPTNTVLNNFGFLFKDQQNGATKQSPDVQANTKGFAPTTIPAMAVSNTSLKTKSSVVSGKLYTSAKGNISLSVYEMSGRLVRTMNVKADGKAIDLNVAKNGLYLVKITSGSENEVVKFAK